MILSLHNLGVINKVMGNFQTAVDFFSKVLKISQNSKHLEMRTWAFLNLGDTFRSLKSYAKALDAYTNAKKLSAKIDNLNMQVRIYSGIGALYQLIGENDTAIEYIDLVIQLNESLQDTNSLAQNYCDMGISYFHLKQFNQAEDYFEKAIHYSTSDEFKANNIRLIADSYYESGRFEEAIKYYRSYNIKKDSLFLVEKQNALNELQMAYDNEKKDRKIFELMVNQENNTLTLKRRSNFLMTTTIILVLMAIALILGLLRYLDKRKATLEIQKKSDKIAKQKEKLETLIDELKAVNRTKDSLFSIIAHDLRGPLGVMKAWLDILADDQDFKNTDEYKQVVTDLRQSASTTFSLLENLLSWARSQRGDIQYKPELLGLKYLAMTNIDLLKTGANEKEITIVCDMPDDLEAYFDQETIQVVIRNLISNAIKFTPKGGTVTVSGKTKDNLTSISVSDTGVGMDKQTIDSILDAHEKVTSTRGTNNEKGTGLGLVICKDFVTHNHGKLTINSTVNKGTSITFTLPLNAESFE
jgi:signal transduction histidine kinase